MRVITATLLVEAVTELSKGSKKLVRAKDVFAWCDRNSVDYEGEGLEAQAILEADLEEARGQRRLLKFKSGECKQSRMGWALIKHGARAREGAARLGWGEMSWNEEKWDWLAGSPPPPRVRRPGVREEPVDGGPEWEPTAEGTWP